MNIIVSHYKFLKESYEDILVCGLRSRINVYQSMYKTYSMNSTHKMNSTNSTNERATHTALTAYTVCTISTVCTIDSDHANMFTPEI